MKKFFKIILAGLLGISLLLAGQGYCLKAFCPMASITSTDCCHDSASSFAYANHCCETQDHVSVLSPATPLTKSTQEYSFLGAQLETPLVFSTLVSGKMNLLPQKILHVPDRFSSVLRI
ncbi:MAG TPA: hypothetical protein DDW49_11585 [Deltaproteobacteria bacterium]|nr:MAG: hypothetical protein A2048_05725 [Deltaproteobacteria bacterium GWA2_45_12]HBF14009.1 hypothetical protein [Deltaproteobacteria bacterium]